MHLTTWMIVNVIIPIPLGCQKWLIHALLLTCSVHWQEISRSSLLSPQYLSPKVPLLSKQQFSLQHWEQAVSMSGSGLCQAPQSQVSFGRLGQCSDAYWQASCPLINNVTNNNIECIIIGLMLSNEKCKRYTSNTVDN